MGKSDGVHLLIHTYAYAQVGDCASQLGTDEVMAATIAGLFLLDAFSALNTLPSHF